MKRPKGGRPRRTIQKRDPRRVIRVLTEGKVTEPSYLAEWGRRNRHVRLDTKEYGMVPLSLVQQAREYQKANTRLQRRGHAVDFDTPFRLWKRYAWLGGTRTPLIVHWPSGIASSGQVRPQFCHAIDLMPTVLDLCGVEAPDSVDGVSQQPIDGASIAATFDDPEAPPPRESQ